MPNMTLQELLGDAYKDGMTLAEVDAALKDRKLVDLNTGKYVDKEKYERAVADKNNASSELASLKEAQKDYDSLKEYHEKGVKAEQDKELKGKLTEAGFKEEYLDYALYQISLGNIKNDDKIVDNARDWLKSNTQYANELPKDDNPKPTITPPTVNTGLQGGAGDDSGSSVDTTIGVAHHWNRNQ